MERLISEDYPKKIKSRARPFYIILLSFMLLITIGGVLLSMPLCNKPNMHVSLIDAFFAATSSVCLTGITFTHVNEMWNVFGQIIILFLVQLAGVGFLVITTGIIIYGGKVFESNSSQASDIITNDRALSGFKFVRRILKYVFLIELIGAFFLSLKLVPMYGAKGLYTSVFLSVTCFCNSGINTMSLLGLNYGLTSFLGDPYIMFIVFFLGLLGGLGFLVLHALGSKTLKFINGKNEKFKLSINAKAVLISTAILIVFGALFYVLSENSFSLKGKSVLQKIWISIFQSANMGTSGYSLTSLSQENQLTRILRAIWMFVGGSPTSVCSGVKNTTMFVLFMTMINSLKGNQDTVIMKHKIEKSTVYKAITIVVLAATMIIAFSFFVNGLDRNLLSFSKIYETLSALLNVGGNLKFTAEKSFNYKLFLILAMLVGRLSFVCLSLMTLFDSSFYKKKILPKAKINIG